MSKEKIITKTGYWECRNPNIYKLDKGLVRVLAQKLRGHTVLDLGCGNGAYTNYLNEHGVTCSGCDGNPHTFGISRGTCFTCDLSRPLKTEKADWVLCLEVGEHIPKEYENQLMKNIHNLNTKGVILSWATPGQGGHGHVNEQPNEYVRELFKGYKIKKDWEKELRHAAVLPWFENTLMVFER